MGRKAVCDYHAKGPPCVVYHAIAGSTLAGPGGGSERSEHTPIKTRRRVTAMAKFQTTKGKPAASPLAEREAPAARPTTAPRGNDQSLPACRLCRTRRRRYALGPAQTSR